MALLFCLFPIRPNPLRPVCVPALIDSFPLVKDCFVLTTLRCPLYAPPTRGLGGRPLLFPQFVTGKQNVTPQARGGERPLGTASGVPGVGRLGVGRSEGEVRSRQ